jgi:hypothetical protein
MKYKTPILEKQVKILMPLVSLEEDEREKE